MVMKPSTWRNLRRCAIVLPLLLIPVVWVSSLRETPAAPLVPSPSVVRETVSNNQPGAAGHKPRSIKQGELLPLDFLDRIVSGRRMSVALPDGGNAAGGIDMIERDSMGVLFIQGRLSEPAPGSFFLQRQTAEGVSGPLVGHLRFDGMEEGWKLEPTPDRGAARFVRRHVDDIVCVNYEGRPSPGEILEAPQAHPTNIPIPTYQTVLPLQSLPGAVGVIYLDFDGETGPFPGWGNFNAAPSGASNAQIFEMWKMVCEDYQGFNLNITTDRMVFDKAPPGRRQQVIITTTTTAAPGSGGVAFVGSFNWSESRPCWVFNPFGKPGAESISHEAGHTLGLSHDGRTTPAETYYLGHGSGSTGWAPIMGTSYYQNLTQWSKGEYLNANQKQDDLFIISHENNDVDYRADDMGETQANARHLEISASNSVSNEGILERTGDVDAFRFTTAGGAATLNVNTITTNPNVDLLAELVDANSSAVIASNNPDTTLNASVSATLPAGDYLLRVRATGRGDPLGIGYTDYGGIGSYLVSGSVNGGIKPDRFSIAENTANGNSIGTVAARLDHGANPLTWSIASGNPDGAFFINPSTGAISVANSAALDFEALSLRWDDPAAIELFVSIADATNPSLNETIRTVVTVTDVNESPTLAGAGATVLEHTAPGTVIAAMSGGDVDHFDFPTFSITAGNPGNAIAIDSGTGEVTVSGNLDVATTTVFPITITATDQGNPALSATAQLTLTVINTADGYQPQGLYRAFFENISGSSVNDLTNDAKFPATPDSLELLGSFDGASHGDQFGSTLTACVIPPVTGTYQFWIASNNAGELRFNPAGPSSSGAAVIASVSGWTNPYDWTAYDSQKSATFELTAGQAYYIEARHKEDTEADHVSVAWRGPGMARQVIPGLFLAPVYQNYAPKITAASFTVLENAGPGQTIGQVSATDVNSGETPSNFTIIGGNEAGIFGMDASNGRLFVAQGGLLNAATTPVHTLTIRATDNGSPALDGTGTISVTVTDTAAPFIWIDPAGGSWTDGGNWQNSAIADGQNNVADFSTLDLVDHTTVTLDGARTIGSLWFGDTTASHDWTLGPGSGDPLTLSTTTGAPRIHVANRGVTLDAAVTGSQGFTKTGDGNLTLGKAGSLTGTVTLSRGVMNTTQTTALGTSSIVLGDLATGASDIAWFFRNGGTTTNSLSVTSYGSGAVTIGTLTGGTLASLSGAMTLNRPVSLHDGTGDRTTFSGKISGAVGTLTLTGTRVVFSNNGNNFTGDMIVSSGSIYQNSASGAIPDGSSVLLDGATTQFRLNGSSETIGGLDGNGIVQNSAGTSNTLTLGGGNRSGTFSGSLINNVGVLNLAKTGTGVQTLTGASSHTGSTTVSGGILLVNGSLGATATTVAAAGTLGGTGTLGGAVSNNGTLAAGSNGIGTFTINQTLTLAGGSKIAMEIAGWTGVAGTGYDVITANALDLTATSVSRITIRPAELNLVNFTESNASFTLVQTISGITGFSADKFQIDASGLSQPKGTWAVQQSGNNLVLAYTALAIPDANGNGISDVWETIRFGNADPGENPANGDPDGDGISNLMEYALDTDPKGFNPNPILYDYVTLGGGRHLRMTISKNPLATNLNFIVETCDSLDDWSAAGTIVEVSTAGQLIVRDQLGTGDAGRRFIRLRVTTVP
jgi:autotransporter-associated beta strand protein